MKSVGVVANHRTINYGTMLQAFAMQRAIEKLGYRAETIDITGISKEITRKKLAYFNSQMTKKDLINAKLPTVRKTIRRWWNKSYARNIAIREAAFRVFREKNFPMSEQRMGRAALTELARGYETVLIGSDQVWLPSNIAADITTLSFVPAEINKVAYASSFGVSMLPASQEKTAETFLGRMDHLSVREQSGKEIIQRLAGREASVVCDPSMLFDSTQWDVMLPPKKHANAPYIFCYFLGNNPWQRALVKQFSKQRGLPIAMPMHMDDFIRSDECFADNALYDLGPEGFLDQIRNASFIFTDSFHGTVFSILYQKSFFTFNRFSQDAVLSTNTRIESLFSIVGLKERHILSAVETSYFSEITTDYFAPLEKLQAFRQQSWEYLEKALAGKCEMDGRL